MLHDSTSEGATGIPLYAEVDKFKKAKNRHTVGDTDLINLDEMYAKVNKDKGQGGARPKVIQGSNDVRQGSGPSCAPSSGVNAPESSLTSGVSSVGEIPDPGYSTVQQVETTTRRKTKRVNSDYYEVVDDVDDNIADSSELGSEYDPSYESVGNIAKNRLSVAKDSSEAGVAREIVATGGGAAIDGENDLGMVHVSYNNKDTKSVWEKPGLIREHIYQEINEAKRHSKRKVKDTKEQKKGARHGKKDGGGSSKKL
jgi:hypothetical protein